MNALRTLKRLILGETWLLPVGVAVVVGAAALLVRPLAGAAWPHVGGLVILAGILVVLTISVRRGTRAR